jgi:hypothetical protein
VALAGDHTLAARILGAAAETRRGSDIPPSPDERHELNRITATVQAALGAKNFAAEFALGGETDVLTLREAWAPAGRSG